LGPGELKLGHIRPSSPRDDPASVAELVADLEKLSPPRLPSVEAIAREVQTYKTRLRPLIREANLYHILPRPDDRHWDGIQYYNPATGQGATCVYKPHSENEAQTIRLKGLEGTGRTAWPLRTAATRRPRTPGQS
jgi:hypothetical protein